MTAQSRLDAAFDTHPLLRDVVIVAIPFLVYTGGMAIVLHQHPWIALLSGIGFTVIFFVVMEALSRQQGKSMSRFLGGDPG